MRGQDLNKQTLIRLIGLEKTNEYIEIYKQKAFSELIKVKCANYKGLEKLIEEIQQPKAL